MGIIILPFDEKWHEKYLIITLLEKGDLSRNEIKRRIRHIQNREIDLCNPHSYGSYDRWIGELKKRFIIDEQGRMLRLTGLGKWIASSKMGTIYNRDRFTDNMCKKCTNRLSKVLCTPLPDTIEYAAKGKFYMDTKCPQCGSIELRQRLSDIADKEHINNFYNQAIEELGKYLKKPDKLIAQKCELSL